MIGDPLLNDLCGILLRFCLHTYALSTDIEKAFLHVNLAEHDRDFTRFLWVSNPSDPESTFTMYRFKVVLFGSASSPFMLSTALDFHLNSHNSAVSNDMKHNLYVDNIISGCQTEESLHYYTTARAIMKEANFNLRSWATNSHKLQEKALADNTFDSETTVNILGLRWDTHDDTVTVAKRQITMDGAQITKRRVLQSTSKQFDPLGWLSPVTIRAKLLLQELWKMKLQWDEPLDDNLQGRWKQIEEAASIMLARKLTALSLDFPLTLHVFADASTKTYGAVAYLQSGNNIDLIMAKSRVSPLKDTILELKGAVIAANLAKCIITTLQPTLKGAAVRLWSDSQIVLHWIFSDKQLKPFVANRVQEISSLFPCTQWRFCPTDDNSADLLTQGITATHFQSSQLWAQSPTWLTSESNWPKWSPSSVLHITTSEETEPLPAVTGSPTTIASGIHLVIDINRHSKLTKLRRVTAYVLRFIKNAKTPSLKMTSPLTATELYNVQRLWIQTAQQAVFVKEFTELKSKQPLNYH